MRPLCSSCGSEIVVAFGYMDKPHSKEAVILMCKLTPICVPCFVYIAEDKGIDWAGGIELWPVPLAE